MKKNRTYQELVTKLNELNKTLPKITLKKLNETVEELEAYDEIKSGREFKKADKVKIAIGIMIFIIFCIGLININGGEEVLIPYYAGSIFFLAGVFMGLYIPIFGLIFLFSHGMTGLGIMAIPGIEMALKNPLSTDGLQPVIFIYLGIVILLATAGIVTTIMHNVSATIRKIPKMILIPWICYTLVLLLSALLPKLLPLFSRLII